jgi:hypothetical protein
MISWIKKNYIQFILLHILIVLGAWLFLNRNGFVSEVPEKGKMARWDAGIYQSIKDNGYINYDETSSGNVGMYPGFPFLWKLTDMNDLGISLLNWLIAVIGIVILARTFEWKAWQVMFILAFPSSMFFMAPYGEALFLLGGSIALRGMYKQDLRLLFFGLLIGSMVRAIGMFFIPALLFMAFLQISGFKWQQLRPIVIQLGVGIGAVVLGTVVVMVVQWVQVGDPFAYFYVQLVRCNHLFQIPDFPLTTWDSYRLLWIDGSAFWICMLAMLACLVWGIQKLTKINLPPAFGGIPPIWFAAGYLFMSLFFLLFNNPKDNLGGTTLYAANRYIFASPFSMVLLMWFLNRKETTRLQVYIALAAIVCTIPLLGNDISFDNSPLWGSMEDGKLIYRMLMVIPWAFLFLLHGKEKFTWQWGVLYAACLFMQLTSYDVYLKGIWIG